MNKQVITGLAALALSLTTLTAQAASLSPEVKALIGSDVTGHRTANIERLSNQIQKVRGIYAKNGYQSVVELDALVQVAATCGQTMRYSVAAPGTGRFLTETITCDY